MSRKQSLVKGYIFIIASAVIFGCMPLMAKLIYEDGVNPLSLVLLRSLFSIPMLALLAICNKQSLKIPLRALPSVSVIALMGCCVTPLLLFTSYQYIASGTATVFHFIYPAAVVVLSMLFFKEKPKRGTVISLLVCIVGIALFYTPDPAFSWLGSGIALFSGVTYAVYIVLLAGFRYQEISGFVFSFYVSVVCAAALCIVCLCSGQLQLPSSPSGWGLCALFAFAINVCAVVLFQKGTFLVGGARASILSTFEPITSVFAGVIIFHETIGWKTLLGTVLVLTASVLIALFDRNEKKEGA